MAITKVTLVGANGKLGPAIIQAFHAVKGFDLSVITRSSSKSKYPDFIHVTRVSDDLPSDELVQALRGQDAVVVIFAGTNDDLQIRLADAAAEAGVRRFMPADFGSCDSSSPRALELMPLYRAKQKVRQHLQQLAAARHGGLTWTSLVCGHFFDYGLETGLLSMDLEARKMRIFDGGEIKWSATTLETIATAVVRVMQNEDETKNRMLYIQSFCVTQNQVLRALEKATGEGWQSEHVSSDKFIEEKRKEVDEDPSNDEAREELVSVVGIVEANWEEKDDFANPLLGLEDEDLDQVVGKVVHS